MYRSLKNNRGFTLIELMITLAIGAVLMAVAIPSFEDFMADSQIVSINNSMVSSVHIARSASMERLVETGICVSSNSMEDDASCDGSGDYNEGWIVYADNNGNGERDNDEDILTRQEAPGSAFTFTPSSSFESQIYFNDDGNSINAAGIPAPGEIVVDYGKGIEVRTITVSANGRVSTSE